MVFPQHKKKYNSNFISNSKLHLKGETISHTLVSTIEMHFAELEAHTFDVVDTIYECLLHFRKPLDKV